MPSSATITAFYNFTANTKARATQVNNNFDVLRGHIIPIDPNTSTAATTVTYDLGSTEYRWRTGYFREIDLKSNTTTSHGFYGSGGQIDVKIYNSTLGSFKSDGLTRGGIKKSQIYSSFALTSSTYIITSTATKVFELSISSNGHIALVGLNLFYNTLTTSLYASNITGSDSYVKVSIYRDGTAPSNLIFLRRYLIPRALTITGSFNKELSNEIRFYDDSVTAGSHTYYMYFQGDSYTSFSGESNADKFNFLELI